MFSTQTSQHTLVDNRASFNSDEVKQLFELIATRKCRVDANIYQPLKQLKISYFKYLKGIMTDHPIPDANKRLLLTQLRNIHKQELFAKYLSSATLEAIITDTAADSKELKAMLSENESIDEFIEKISNILDNSNTINTNNQIVPESLKTGSRDYVYTKSVPEDEHTNKINAIRESAVNHLANNQVQQAVDKYQEGLDLIKTFPCLKEKDQDNEHQILIGLIAALNNKAILLLEEKKNREAFQCNFDAVNLIYQLPFKANENEKNLIHASKNNLLTTTHTCAIEFHEKGDYLSAFTYFSFCIEWSNDLNLHESDIMINVKKDYISCAMKSAHLLADYTNRRELWIEVIKVSMEKSKDFQDESQQEMYITTRKKLATAKLESAKDMLIKKDSKGVIERFIEIFILYENAPKHIFDDEKDILENIKLQFMIHIIKFINNDASNNLLEIINFLEGNLASQEDESLAKCYRYILASYYLHYSKIAFELDQIDESMAHIEKAFEYWKIINPVLTNEYPMKDTIALYQNAMNIYIGKLKKIRTLGCMEYSANKISYLEKSISNYCSIKEEFRITNHQISLANLKIEAEFVMEAATNELDSQLSETIENFSNHQVTFFSRRTSHTYALSHQYLQLITFGLYPLLESKSKINAETTKQGIELFLEKNPEWPTIDNLNNIINKIINFNTAKKVLTTIIQNIIPVENIQCTYNNHAESERQNKRHRSS